MSTINLRPCNPKWYYARGVYHNVMPMGKRPKISESTIRYCIRHKADCECDYPIESRCVNCKSWMLPIFHYVEVEGERKPISLCPKCQKKYILSISLGGTVLNVPLRKPKKPLKFWEIGILLSKCMTAMNSMVSQKHLITAYGHFQHWF